MSNVNKNIPENSFYNFLSLTIENETTIGLQLHSSSNDLNEKPLDFDLH